MTRKCLLLVVALVTACKADDEGPANSGYDAAVSAGPLGGAAGPGGVGGSGGATGPGGVGGSGGATGPGGAAGAGGVAGPGGTNDAGPSMVDSGSAGGRPGGSGTDSGTALGDASTATRDASSADAANVANLPKFSFFVTSLAAIRQLSKDNNGFGGDLRFGETGEGAGLRGADKICAAAAEIGMPGSSAKQWRAFLSAKAGGEGGGAVNAIERIGAGPWYDRQGRLVAMNVAGLLRERPAGDTSIINDLPNETGAPNRAGSAENGQDDNHDTVTASNAQGMYDGKSTCTDWTSTASDTTGATAGAAGGGVFGGFGGGGFDPLAGHNGPALGHTWPAMSGRHWIASHPAPGCGKGIVLVQTGAGSGTGIGNGGGYGGFYCFALTP